MASSPSTAILHQRPFCCQVAIVYSLGNAASHRHVRKRPRPTSTSCAAGSRPLLDAHYPLRHTLAFSPFAARLCALPGDRPARNSLPVFRPGANITGFLETGAGWLADYQIGVFTEDAPRWRNSQLTAPLGAVFNSQTRQAVDCPEPVLCAGLLPAGRITSRFGRPGPCAALSGGRALLPITAGLRSCCTTDSFRSLHRLP